VRVHHDRLITGVAAAFAGSALLLAGLAVVYNPVLLVLSLALGAAAYFMWYQASGRLAARVYRSVERQAAKGGGRGRTRTRTRETGGFGAGPREDWTPPGGDRRARRNGGPRGPGGPEGREQRYRRGAPTASEGPSTEEAYRRLGLDQDADEAQVKAAYRRKVKEVHPDTEGGDEEAFKRVTEAYERLT